MPTPAAPPLDRPALYGLPLLSLVAYLLVGNRYGYFRDELYFMDCARHLAWGYADHAPLIAIWTKLGLFLDNVAQGSVLAFRLPAALAGAAYIVLIVCLTRECGGHRFAQRLAGLVALLCPALVASRHLLTMNAFEPLFWTGCLLVVRRFQRTGNPRLWVLFGILAGLGIMNKHSSVFFLAALFAAMLQTPLRRVWTTPLWWAGLAIAALIALPNVIWQAQHNFATLELLANVKKLHKNVDLPPVDFILQQILTLNPVWALVWIGGLLWSLMNPPLRWAGLTYLALLGIMIALKGKVYYLYPIYGLLFALGGVAWEQWTRQRRWIGATLAGVGTVSSLIILPVVAPILPPDRLISYLNSLHLAPPKAEVAHSGPLPQHYGDQFGWPTLVSEVAHFYWQLPLTERTETALFANNYGEAGALNYFGPRYGLPSAISGHQNYWFWGPQGQARQGANLIVLQDSVRSLSRWCAEVRVLGEHRDPYGMEEENGPILYCRGLKVSLADNWPKLKKWN